MKKMVVLCLSVVMIVVATVSGTISASKSADERASAIHSGAVSVEVVEEERSGDGGFTPVAPFPSFFPDPAAAIGSESLVPDAPVLWHDGSALLFWDSLPCAKDKIVSIRNTSSKDAYIRTVFAFEDSNGVADKIYFNVSDSEAFALIGRTEIDGIPYKLYTYTYDEPLAAGAVSAPSLLQFVFGNRVSDADLEAIGGEYDILIAAEAVQTAGFDDAEAALDALFGQITVKNHPWA